MIISCRDVHKSYRLASRDVVALRGVTFEIDHSGFYAIMGQSGSGKSTLLHLLGALDRPTSGEIYIAGEPIHTLGERAATAFRRTRVGIVFQQFNLIPTLSARENIELPGLLAGQPRDWLAQRSGELLDRLGLADRASHRPEALSGGEQQRVAIARALLFRPPLLLADEPTGNLDSASSERLWALLSAVALEHDTTIVMVTHEPAAAAHCQRVFVVRDGCVIGHLDSEGLDAGGVATRYQQLVGSPRA
jgi:putative ABC transport system ATP-binding protein